MERNTPVQREPLSVKEVMLQLMEIFNKYKEDCPTNIHEIKVVGPTSASPSKRKVILT